MLLTIQHVLSYPIVQCASKNAHEQRIEPSLRLNYKIKHFFFKTVGVRTNLHAPRLIPQDLEVNDHISL